MTDKYRDPSFNRTQIMVFTALGDLVRPHLLNAIEAGTIDPISDEYHDWVREWKVLYNHISQWTREIKNTKDQSGSTEQAHALALVSLRYIANTMLNARQLLKDRRRAAFMALDAANLA